MVEVEEADGASLASSPRVNCEGHAIGEVFMNAAIAGHSGGVDVLKVEYGAVGLFFRHPLVESEQGLLQANP